jgi:hypothetical protein
MRLLSRDLAAQEWGWYEGLRMVDYGHDDMLRELLLHLHSQRRWQMATPVFRKLMVDPQTGVSENTVELRPMKFLPGTRLWGHNRWYQYGIGNPNSRTFYPFHLCAVRIRNPNSRTFYPFHLCAVRIPFNKDNYVQNARFEYMVEEGGGKGFYYLTIHEWVARCSDPSECVALLDRLDPDALYADFVFRCRQFAYFQHLVNCLCHDDAPRKAYIARKMEEVERDAGGYEWPL